MKYIIILSFALTVFLYAEQGTEEALSLQSKESQYQKDLERQQMLREAKFLKKRYEESISKLQNWEIKKEELKQEFIKKYNSKDIAFGEGDEYGKQRAKKRKQEYFDSLQTQEQHIIDSFTAAQAKLQDMKSEFIFRFAVPLTDSEINDGIRPAVKDRERRAQMLYKYINENDAWERCQSKVVEFDKVQSVAGSIEKLFPETNLTKNSILVKSKRNEKRMQNHLEQLQSIDEKYRVEYGVSIISKLRASSMLEFINTY